MSRIRVITAECGQHVAGYVLLVGWEFWSSRALVVVAVLVATNSFVVNVQSTSSAVPDAGGEC
jgi:hypothetical protein